METSEVVTLFFSGLVAMATIAYVVLTRALVKETQLLRKAHSVPHVSVYLRPSSRWVHILDMVVVNTGPGPALNVRWKVECSDSANQDVHVDVLRSLDGLGYMAPGQRIESFFGSALKLMHLNPIPAVTVHADYDDVLGGSYRTTCALEPAKYKGLSRVGDPPEHEMAKALSELAKTFRQVVRSSRFRVVGVTEKELAEREARDQREREERRGSGGN